MSVVLTYAVLAVYACYFFYSWSYIPMLVATGVRDEKLYGPCNEIVQVLKTATAMRLYHYSSSDRDEMII